jgi:hypothetical protein
MAISRGLIVLSCKTAHLRCIEDHVHRGTGKKGGLFVFPLILITPLLVLLREGAGQGSWVKPMTRIFCMGVAKAFGQMVAN